jgi:hypothetical protein
MKGNNMTSIKWLAGAGLVLFIFAGGSSKPVSKPESIVVKPPAMTQWVCYDKDNRITKRFSDPESHDEIVTRLRIQDGCVPQAR